MKRMIVKMHKLPSAMAKSLMGSIYVNNFSARYLSNKNVHQKGFKMFHFSKLYNLILGAEKRTWDYFAKSMIVNNLYRHWHQRKFRSLTDCMRSSMDFCSSACTFELEATSFFFWRCFSANVFSNFSIRAKVFCCSSFKFCNVCRISEKHTLLDAAGESEGDLASLSFALGWVFSQLFPEEEAILQTERNGRSTLVFGEGLLHCFNMPFSLDSIFLKIRRRFCYGIETRISQKHQTTGWQNSDFS